MIAILAWTIEGSRSRERPFHLSLCVSVPLYDVCGFDTTQEQTLLFKAWNLF